MRTILLPATILTIGALALQSCANYGNDHFAHAVKSGNARMAVSTMQPNQAWLRIHEKNGGVYYPIHYAICRGDEDATFGLISAGSPTRLEGRSLAYSAARIARFDLAEQLVQRGYGTQAEVNQAREDIARQKAATGRANAAVAAGVLGLLFFMAASGGGGSSDSEYEHQKQILGVMENRGEIPR